MKTSARITSKGQVTIPVEIRKRLGLSDGQLVIFELDNGSVRLFPEIRHPFKELKALRAKVRFSRKEMNALLKESKRAWDRIG